MEQAMPRKTATKPAKVAEVAETVAAEAPEAEAPKNETPRERFQRLAPARTNAALKRIQLLSNLASSAYDFENSESAQIIEALFDAVHDLKRKFEKKTGGKKSGFTFKTKARAA
jgi:CHASE1-domain containing sensor protein